MKKNLVSNENSKTLTQIFEPTPIIVEMDMEIQVLFATFDPIVGMLESIPIDPIIILASIK
jgi:hypothetical protein